MSVQIRNERTKMLANAVNNLGVAAIVTGGIVPAAGYFVGSLQVDDPLRLLSLVVVWVSIGGTFVAIARRLLGDLV